MRLFTLIVSGVLIACGVMMLQSGDATGWLVVGFFGLCLLVAIFEPRLPKPWLASDYRLHITEDEVAAEYRRKTQESIRWEDVKRVWYVTTSAGPYLPDQWIVLEGEHGGCSFPTDASGFELIWDELTRRFPGFDYGPIIRGGTDDSKHLCWER